MKLIIDIPEDEVNECKMQVDMIKQEGFLIESLNTALKIHVANGIPLPKGHGRLIDEEEILRELGSYHIGGLDAIKNYNGENTWADGLHTAWVVIDDAETIIEADKEYKAEVITRGNCMLCGKELTEGLFLCKECGDKAKKESEDHE